MDYVIADTRFNSVKLLKTFRCLIVHETVWGSGRGRSYIMEPDACEILQGISSELNGWICGLIKGRDTTLLLWQGGENIHKSLLAIRHVCLAWFWRVAIYFFIMGTFLF